MKWTRETRPQILDKIYTSSKYFEMPPPRSFAKAEQSQAAASGYSLDQDYAQEEVVPPGATLPLENDVKVEIVTTDDFQQEVRYHSLVKDSDDT